VSKISFSSFRFTLITFTCAVFSSLDPIFERCAFQYQRDPDASIQAARLDKFSMVRCEAVALVFISFFRLIFSAFL
jgi:hypothetical protein